MEKLSTPHFSLILVLLCWVVLKIMTKCQCITKTSSSKQSMTANFRVTIPALPLE